MTSVRIFSSSFAPDRLTHFFVLPSSQVRRSPTRFRRFTRCPAGHHPNQNELTAACVSSSGRRSRSGTPPGYVHAWSAATAVYDEDPDEFPDAEPRYPDPKVNFQSLPTTDPPREAECVKVARGELDPSLDEENVRVPTRIIRGRSMTRRTVVTTRRRRHSPTWTRIADFIISVGKPRTSYQSR